MSNKFLINISILYFIFDLYQALYFMKNKNIANLSKYTENHTIFDYSNLKNIKEKIEESELIFLIFHSTRCHHCLEAMPIYEEVSKFELAKEFDFIKVNCDNSIDICDYFKINGYPTVKLFKNKTEVQHDSDRTIESFLEILDKLKSPDIIHLKYSNDILDFEENYGDISFITFSEYINGYWFECLLNLAKDYKSIFYFGYHNSNENVLKVK